jgi:transposase
MIKRNACAIGIDLSDRKAQICVMDLGGIVDEFAMVLDEDSLRKQVPLVDADNGVVVVETGTRSSWVKRVLEARGMRVIVADARKLRMVSQNTRKSDTNDARILARIGLSDETLLSATWVRPPELQQIYNQLKARDQAVRRRGDLIREVRSLVKHTGRTLRASDTGAFARLRTEVPTELWDATEPLFDIVEACTTAVKRYDDQLEGLARTREDARRLLAVPGVGPVTALAFVCVIGDPKRFARVRDVGAYIGLVPRTDQSGIQDPALGISKAGNKLLRRSLLQCAHYITGPFGKPSALRTWAEEFVARHGDRARKRARIAVARKLAVQLLAAWRSETAWKAFPGAADEPTSTPETVNGDDCAATPATTRHAAVDDALTEIAASPSTRTPPCTRPADRRSADESTGRGGGRRSPDKASGKEPTPVRVSSSGPRSATPAARVPEPPGALSSTRRSTTHASRVTKPPPGEGVAEGGRAPLPPQERAALAAREHVPEGAVHRPRRRRSALDNEAAS